MDVCILAGCDYCETIRGIAATTAYKQVKKLGSLEAVVAEIEKEKLPEGVDYAEVRGGPAARGPSRTQGVVGWHNRAQYLTDPHIPHFRASVSPQVRKLFHTPEVTPAGELELKWVEPDEAALVEFLVKEKVRPRPTIERSAVLALL